MEEVEAMDFYNRVVGGETKYREVTLQASDNATAEFKLTAVNRKDLLNELSRLPPEMMETIDDAEDADEAEEQVKESGMLQSLNGDTIEAFENIVAYSLEHDDLTSHHIQQLVQELDFEVLFSLGAEVIELSLENSGRVKDFHGLDLDKN